MSDMQSSYVVRWENDILHASCVLVDPFEHSIVRRTISAVPLPHDYLFLNTVARIAEIVYPAPLPPSTSIYAAIVPHDAAHALIHNLPRTHKETFDRLLEMFNAHDPLNPPPCLP